MCCTRAQYGNSFFFLWRTIIGDLSLSSQLVVSNEEAGDFERDFSQFWREETTRPEKKNSTKLFSCRPPLSLFFCVLSLTITTTTNTARSDGEKQGGGEEEEEEEEYDDDENKEKEKWTRH